MQKEQHEDHYYGGQAVIEGVMMRGLDKCAIAVRRTDGRIVLTTRDLGAFAATKGWLKWPLIRGNVMLIETLAVGMAALQFSANVLAAEEQEKQGQVKAAPQQPAQGISRLAMGVTMAFAVALAIGLFILLNVVEGVLRLGVVLLYIVSISPLGYVRRLFQYHGAEHATINCFEAGEPVTVDNCAKYGTLHPRCGTAFLLVVIIVGMRILIRLALLPPVAGIAYEVIRWAGRHRDSWLAQALAGPGMAMQLLTTRKPGPEQLETAIYALATVAPEVDYPASGPPVMFVNERLEPIGDTAAGEGSGEQVAQANGPARTDMVEGES